ncbi:hypothetical protein KPP03845_100110 [Streptomyces xanthophaeus]|nr:hypothetical protein KPP03845_100110 [Streptomyces xanthophaeus]
MVRSPVVCWIEGGDAAPLATPTTSIKDLRFVILMPPPGLPAHGVRDSSAKSPFSILDLPLHARCRRPLAGR